MKKEVNDDSPSDAILKSLVLSLLRCEFLHRSTILFCAGLPGPCFL